MSNKDIITIVAVAFVSAIFSYIIAGLVFGGEDAENLKAPIVEKISTEFPIPGEDNPYFNSDSLNPTKTIIIGTDPENSKPF